jgi:hypothetical protein
MSENEKTILESPVVIIARHHQSAPKETDADREVRKAAEEIASGNFVPAPDDDEILDSLAIDVQRGRDIPLGKDVMHRNSLLETELLMKHPRVVEALAKLEQEKNEAKSSQEFIEKSQMLYELNAEASDPSRWDGQGRWIGRENEEMRIGEILSPCAFMQKLCAVIGEHRVFLNGFAVLKRVALMAPDKEPQSRILIPGQAERRDDGLVQVATLQYPCSSEWMVMKFDEYGVPTTPKYLGWRTALLALIKQGIITERESILAFPLVSMSDASAWYREQLFMIRNERGTVN